jgi:hypothetical protein
MLQGNRGHDRGVASGDVDGRSGFRAAQEKLSQAPIIEAAYADGELEPAVREVDDFVPAAIGQSLACGIEAI